MSKSRLGLVMLLLFAFIIMISIQVGQSLEMSLARLSDPDEGGEIQVAVFSDPDEGGEVQSDTKFVRVEKTVSLTAPCPPPTNAESSGPEC